MRKIIQLIMNDDNFFALDNLGNIYELEWDPIHKRWDFKLQEINFIDE